MPPVGRVSARAGRVRTDRSLRRVLRGAVVVGCGLLGIAIAVRAVPGVAVDLAVYRAGGAAVLAGRPLYGSPVFRDMQFTYPPFAALVFTPLAVLPAAVGQAALVVVKCALLLFVAQRSWRSVAAMRGRALGTAAVVTASLVLLTEAVRYDFYVGQINLVLLALVVADLTGRDDRPWRGMGVGIAAGIKLTPLIFVAYLLVVRRFRAAAVATGTFAGTVLLALPLRSEFVEYWLDGTFADSGRVYGDVASTHNQSLRGLLLRSGLVEGRVPWVWVASAIVVGVVVLVVAARATQQGRRLQAVTICGMCAAVVSPWSWGHHWVWILPLAVVTAQRVIVSAGRTPWSVIGLLLPLTLPQVRALADPLDDAGPAVFTSGPIALLLGNTYLVIFVATLVLTLVETRHQPRHADRVGPLRTT
jgi:alpha-1,2-mannosyltransferase